MKTDWSRRGFIKAAAAGVGVGAMAAMAGCSAESSDSSEGAASGSAIPTAYEADILIVGGGLAGFAAGLKALELGVAKVTLIEKGSGEGMDWGGSSLITSGNYIYPIGDTESARAQYVDAVYSSTGGMGHLDLITMMSERSYSTLQWMISQGVEYGEPFQRYPQYPELEMRNQGAGTTMPLMRSKFEENGGQLLFGVKAQKINLDESGVCGILASDSEGSYFNISAKKTLICTGGYVSNKDIVEELCGAEAGGIFSRAPYTITGDAIAMVKEIGGCLVNARGHKTIYNCAVHYPSGTQTGPEAGYAIAINSKGKRYWDEATGGQEHGRKLLEQPGYVGALICDSKSHSGLEKLYGTWEKLGAAYKTDTIEEMAEIFGVPVDAMVATIKEYNEHVVGDHTEGLAVDKSATACTIDTPPYYGLYPCRPGAGHAFGGISVNDKVQVLEADGRIIPNLFAAGEVCGGFFHDGYITGTCTSRAIITGVLAAETACSEL